MQWAEALPVSLHGFRVTLGTHFLPAWRVLRTERWWPTGRSPHVTAREAGNGERGGMIPGGRLHFITPSFRSSKVTELVLILGPEAGEARCRGWGRGRPHRVIVGLLADWVGPIPGWFLWLQQPHPAPRVPHQAGEGQRGHHGTTAGCPGPLHPVPDR